ncbi:MAG: Ger(x)C family spore germination protein, partial [Bacillota bacterium]
AALSLQVGKFLQGLEIFVQVALLLAVILKVTVHTYSGWMAAVTIVGNWHPGIFGHHGINHSYFGHSGCLLQRGIFSFYPAGPLCHPAICNICLGINNRRGVNTRWKGGRKKKMKKIRAVALFLLLVLLAMVISGCWDLRELETDAMIVGIGIDKGPGDELTLSVEQAMPTSVGGGGASAGGGGGGMIMTSRLVHRARGKILTEARDRLETVLVRQLFFGYTGVIVVGEEAAREDMDRIIAFIYRSPLIRRSAFILITPGKASDVLATLHPHESTASEIIRNLLTETDQTGVAFPVRVGELFEILAIPGIEPVATRVTVSAEQTTPSSPGEADHTDKGMQNEASDLPSKTGQHKIEGMAVFKGDRLVGWLDKDESRGWGWILGRIKHGHSDVLTPRSARGRFSPVTFRLEGGKTSTKISFKDGQPVALLTIKAKGDVLEWVNSQNLVDPGVIRSLEADYAAKIKSQAEAAVRKAQEFNSDIFGFGFAFFRQHRQEWKTEFAQKWPEIFPQMRVEVKVEATILHTGTVIRALKLK